MQCMILAGGFGTRLYPLTESKAKALLLYEDKPNLTHIVEKVPKDMRITISINDRHKIEFLQWKRTVERQIHLSLEYNRLGAMSALNNWIRGGEILEDVLVIGGDNHFEFSLEDFLLKYDRYNTLVAVHDINDLERAKQFGVITVECGMITKFEKKPLEPKSSLVSTACMIFPNRIFKLLSAFCYEKLRDTPGEFISYLVENDKVYSYEIKGKWIDIGDYYQPIKETYGR